MPKPRSPNRDKAYEIYKEHNGKIELNAIAAKLGIGDGTVRGWKNKDKWEERLFGTPPKKSTERSKQNTERSEPKKRGGQAGNTNAKGKGEGKIGNQNALKHGFFAKYLPEQTVEIIEFISEQSPADILWQQIEIQYAAIINAQRIMFVEDINDTTKEINFISSSSKSSSTEKRSTSESSEQKGYTIQFAWEKQANYLNSQSRAMSELRSLIKQFVEIADPFDERKNKLRLISAKVSKEEAEVKKLLISDNIPKTTTIIVKKAGDR